MGNCRDCKWWDQEEPKPDDEGRRFCHLISMAQGTDALAVTDGCSQCGGFFTRPDFGCVQFEARV